MTLLIDPPLRGNNWEGGLFGNLTLPRYPMDEGGPFGNGRLYPDSRLPKWGEPGHEPWQRDPGFGIPGQQPWNLDPGFIVPGQNWNLDPGFTPPTKLAGRFMGTTSMWPGLLGNLIGAGINFIKK